jgi:hypothetical protein
MDKYFLKKNRRNDTKLIENRTYALTQLTHGYLMAKYDFISVPYLILTMKIAAEKMKIIILL